MRRVWAWARRLGRAQDALPSSGFTAQPLHNSPLSVRFFRNATVRAGLADRIRDLLPPEAVQAPVELDQPVVALEKNVMTIQFETEIVEALKLLKSGSFDDAVEVIVQKIPLHISLSVLAERLLPYAPRYIGVYELALALVCHGQRALAAQLLQHVGKSDALEEVIFVAESASAQSEQELDDLTSYHLDTRFPQLLGRDGSLWLQTRLLAQSAIIKDGRFSVFIQRYGLKILRNSELLWLLLSLIPTEFGLIARWARPYFKENSSSLRWMLPVFLKVASTPSQFQFIWRPLRSDLKSGKLPVYTIRDLLQAALRVDASYDIATIAAAGAHKLHPDLLGRAILALAWAQPHLGDSDADLVVSSPGTKEAARVWRALERDQGRGSLVLAAAARQLSAQLDNFDAKDVPGRVLWSLLLSNTIPVGPYAALQLTPLVLHRPRVEQMRYMALPQTSVEAILTLISKHAAQLTSRRKLAGVSLDTPVGNGDVQLMLAGLVLATEKGVEKPRASIAKSNFGLNINRSLAETFMALFDRWDMLQTMEFLEALHNKYGPSQQMLLVAVNVLLQLKMHILAFQLFQQIGSDAAGLPMHTLNAFVLSTARDSPELSYRVVHWLGRHAHVEFDRQILIRMARILCHSAQLSEPQIVNRIQRIRKKLKAKGEGGLGKQVSIDLVNMLLHRAENRGNGAWRRLSWALAVARNEDVPREQFVRWEAQLSRMRDRKVGYFA